MVEWSQSKTVELIEHLRQNPIIWACKSGPSNRHRKEVAMQNIARKIHVSPEEVKKKWQGLSSQFSREYSRVQREKQRTGRTFHPVWYGYKLLMFLANADNRNHKWRQKNENFNHGIYDDGASSTSMDSLKIKNHPIEKYTENLPSPPSHNNSFSYTDVASTTSRDSIRIENNPIKEYSGDLASPALQDNNYSELFAHAYNDDLLAFGLYIASKLKALNDPCLQATAKLHISRLIYEIEMKQYQRNSEN